MDSAAAKSKVRPIYMYSTVVSILQYYLRWCIRDTKAVCVLQIIRMTASVFKCSLARVYEWRWDIKKHVYASAVIPAKLLD